MTFTFLLKSLDACSKAVEWRGDRDLKTTWAECERGDWMLWLAGKMADKKGWPTRQQVVLAACDCAKLSLPIFEKKYPKDSRPRTAIETARKWARGEVSLQEVRIAAYAAYAACAAAYADAAYPAYAAAAYAAYADAAPAYAYAAAAYAGYAAAAYPAPAAYAAYPAYAVYAATLRECADICRAKLEVPDMKP